MFEVAVGDVSGRVGERDQARLDRCRKGVSPHVGFAVTVEVHSAHPWLGSISRTKEGRILWDDFR